MKEISKAPKSDYKSYEQGQYSTYFLNEYNGEKELIFKLQQRKPSKIRTIAEHVVTQLNPAWREEEGEEEEILRNEISKNFNLSTDCRLINDNVMYRISADKKLQVEVQSIKNLTYKGHFAVFIVCIANEEVSFNKESFVFLNYDLDSDAFNPEFKESSVVFGNVDLTDQSSFNLVVLVEFKKKEDLCTYEVYGMNVIPAVTSPDTILNGVFEIPLLDLELSGALFQELNNINPWQFQHRFLKENKGNPRPASIILRQSNSSLGDMYPKKACKFGYSKMFMRNSDKPQKSQKLPSAKMSDCVQKGYKRDAIENDIKEFIKDKLYEEG